MKGYYPTYRSHLRVVALVLLLFSWSCSKDNPIEPKVDLPSRTILYYLGADNNLQDEADEKTEALRLGFPGGNDRLVIYRDTETETPRLLEVYQDKIGENKIREVKTYPEQNSATAETFQTVLNDVEALAPADSYGLILFSHATGWLPTGALLRPEAALLQMGLVPIRTYTIAMDGTTELGLKEFANAIPDRFFDFIAFEACFMAGVEVLYELKDKTDYILSSSAEILSPGFAPIFPASLAMLYRPEADLIGFAQAYFDFWDGQRGDYRSATVTVAKTDELPALANWVNRSGVNELPTATLSEIQHFDRYSTHRLFFDFEDYYQHTTTETGAMNELADLFSAIVVYQAATPTFIPSQRGFDINRHSGLTTYIPQEGFQKLNERYRELAWYQSITRPVK